MTSSHQAWLSALFLRLVRLRPNQTPSEWVAENVSFREPGCTGPFIFDGREYLHDPINDWNDDEVTDMVEVFATRMGKTRSIYGGLAWKLAHRSIRALYVKPHRQGTAGAQDDSRNRFRPMIEGSPTLAAMIPRGGNARHLWATYQQRIGGSIVDWTGSNSVGALASNPCDVVVQDEVDKFNSTRKRNEQGEVVEADASDLADERTNECSTPKRVKSSTPTLASGKIWTKLLRTDLRRYNMPCPHCNEPVIFAWAKAFTILPKTGREAYIKWDSEAKRQDGTWDEARVKSTAHAECPHCQGKILDSHKGWMLREAWMRSKGGEDGKPRKFGWVATQTGTPGHRGYHLPAMYGMHKASNFGEMAVRFINEVNSLAGPRGFINSMLAEPYESQTSMGKRTELILARVEGGRRIMTIDCQAKAPYFWHVIRSHGDSESQAIAAGPCDTWEEMRTIQLANNVPDIGVFIDSGWGNRDDAEVYRVCTGYCEIVRRPTGLPVCLGWTPTKGMPTRKRWKDKDTGLFLPYRVQPTDPFLGTADAGKVRIELFEFAAEFFKDILESMRKGQAGYKWSVAEDVATDEYWRHMDGQHKVVIQKFNGMSATRWVARHREWPDHMFACEYAQVAAAAFLKFLPIEQIIQPKGETD